MKGIHSYKFGSVKPSNKAKSYLEVKLIILEKNIKS